MPLYVFKNPNTGDTKQILQAMNEEHSYTDESGLKWERVFTIPNTHIDSDIDAFSEKDFSAKVANKNYTVGDLWDKSQELSEKRQKAEGVDAVKQKYQEKRKKIKNSNKK